MKKYICTLALVFTVAFTFAQQTQVRPEVKAKQITATLNSETQLTGEQQGQVFNAYWDYLKKTNEIEALKTSDSKTYTSKLKTLRTELEKQLGTILTADQLSSWKASKSNTELN